MFLQLEQGCLEVYRHKVDHASHACAQLHQDLVNVEVELAALFASLGDPAVSQQIATICGEITAMPSAFLSGWRRSGSVFKKSDRLHRVLEYRNVAHELCALLGLQDLGRSLNELWNLMQTLLEEQQQFEHITNNIEVIEEDITVPGSLALDIIDRFASKGVHLNLKCAECAINKFPALVESLTLRTKAWEEEQWGRFMFDGVTVFHHQFSQLQKSVFIDL
ncbi:unnamed protein product [Sphagnum balticum]